MGDVSRPEAEGKGTPSGLPSTVDVEQAGYVVEEFFLDGEAVSYRPAAGTELGVDGRWTVEEAETATFRTRFLVVRPASEDAFNGTVFVNWNNVSGGYEAGGADDPELFNGYAWVGATAQKVGVDGYPGVSPFGDDAPPGEPLKRFDPERYGSLSHPGDQFSFDLFTQIARAVGSERTGAVDPMGGLQVQRLVAVGGSQSGMRLHTYINAIQPLTNAFDGFLPTINSFRGAPLADWALTLSSLDSIPTAVVRDDLDVPVFMVLSESEAPGRARVPAAIRDTDRFRLWEVAGCAHASIPDLFEQEPGWIHNPLNLGPVLEAAYRAMQRWLTEGTPPASVPYIEIEGDPPDVARDEFGNAMGGLRLPEMAAPVRTYQPTSVTTSMMGTMFGRARPFTPEQLAELYGNEDGYRKAYDAAVDAAVGLGVLLAQTGERMKAANASGAEAVSWPTRSFG